MLSKVFTRKLIFCEVFNYDSRERLFALEPHVVVQLVMLNFDLPKNHFRALDKKQKKPRQLTFRERERHRRSLQRF